MKKIPTLFVKDWGGTNLATTELNPACDWINDPGVYATRKWDGFAVLIEDRKLYKRYDAKIFIVELSTNERRDCNRKIPEGFIPCQEVDEKTGHQPGWIPCKLPDDKRIINVFESGDYPDGTYEFVGPKVGTRSGANPEKLTEHMLIKHGGDIVYVEKTYEAIKHALEFNDIEGIVFYHPDGRMAKIKKTDFGLTR